MHLAPCPACRRHLRGDETLCPFCAACVEPTAAPIFRATPRMGRAAMLAFRTLAIGAAGATAGCGASHGRDDDAAIEDGGDDAAVPAPPDAGTDAGELPAPLYGGPTLMDAGFDAGVLAMYGGPTPEDAGTDAGGAVALYGGPTPVPVDRDAGDDGGAVVAAYGAPGTP